MNSSQFQVNIQLHCSDYPWLVHRTPHLTSLQKYSRPCSSPITPLHSQDPLVMNASSKWAKDFGFVYLLELVCQCIGAALRDIGSVLTPFDWSVYTEEHLVISLPCLTCCCESPCCRTAGVGNCRERSEVWVQLVHAGQFSILLDRFLFLTTSVAANNDSTSQKACDDHFHL